MNNPYIQVRLRREYAERVNRVIDYIHENLSESLSLSKIADVAAFSPYHFHRIFHSITGETLYNFILRLRLEKAAHKLRYSLNRSVTEIAYECGFSSASAFSRAFRDHFSVTPLEYRDGFLKNGGGQWAEGLRAGAARPAGRYTMNVATQLDTVGDWHISVRNLPDKHVAYIRHTGFREYVFNRAINDTFKHLRNWLEVHGIPADGRECIGLTYDDTNITAPERCRYRACYTVPPAFGPEGEVGTMTVPGGSYAVCRIEGDWSRYGSYFQEVTDFLFGVWFPTSGYIPGGELCYMEQYYTTYDSGKLVMDLCIPAEPF